VNASEEGRFAREGWQASRRNVTTSRPDAPAH
jgi:hypothetical protein